MATAANNFMQAAGGMAMTAAGAAGGGPAKAPAAGVSAQEQAGINSQLSNIGEQLKTDKGLTTPSWDQFSAQLRKQYGIGGMHVPYQNFYYPRKY